MKKRPAGCVKTQSTRAQFTCVFSKSVETGWFTEHLLNGIGFQIAAAWRQCEYYTMPKNENQAVFQIFPAILGRSASRGSHPRASENSLPLDFFLTASREIIV